MKKYYVLFFIFIIVSGCSKKITNERIKKLEGQEAILQKTQQVNDLRLKEEKLSIQHAEAAKEVTRANEKASASAAESQKVSEELSANPGDSRLSKRANKSASRASGNARSAMKANSRYGKFDDELKDVRKELEKAEGELNEMKSRIEFVPN